MSIKVLYVGDTQVNVRTSIKGIDSWTFAYYSDSARYLRNALRAADDIILDHIPSMNCIADMPSTVEEMKQYDAILVSDVGYNNIVFQPGNVQPFKVPMGPDRVKALCEYVNQGGGFMMIGGWLSFSGMQGKGMYGGTKVEELLPVTCMPRGADDRMEITEGYAMQLDDPNHPIVKDIDWKMHTWSRLTTATCRSQLVRLARDVPASIPPTLAPTGRAISWSIRSMHFSGSRSPAGLPARSKLVFRTNQQQAKDRDCASSPCLDY